MATTQYSVSTVIDNVFTEALEGKTFNKKATAVKAAQELRDSEGVSVVVQTQTGTVVFEQDAPKKINMSPRYTRVVDLPEGVEAPEGGRVAYVRPRQNAAVVHFAGEEKGKQYALLNLKTGKLLKQRFATTRDCGQAMSEGAALPKPKPEPEATVSLEKATA